jgi:RNA recognition motif-containing protein
MNTKLYVGNLSNEVTDNALKDLFAPHGAVTEIKLVLDRDTGKPRGFGFVTMATRDQAAAAIKALNGLEWEGRNLTVNEARPRAERPAYPSGMGGRRSPRY